MNAEANLLRDSVNALLTQSAGSSEADLLTAFRDAGLDMALVAEADGGHGLSLTEASAIAFGWGTHGAGLPVVELLLAPALAHAAGRFS